MLGLVRRSQLAAYSTLHKKVCELLVIVRELFAER